MSSTKVKKSVQTCPSCHSENSIEEDFTNGEQILVCVNCGVVVENGFLTANGTVQNEQNSYVPKSNSGYTELNLKSIPNGIRQHLSGRRNCAGLKAGLSVLKNLSSKFQLPVYMSGEAKSLFLLAFKNEHFRLKPISFKGFLAAVCVYVKMRQSNWPVSVNNICSTMCCTKEDIINPMNQLSKHMNITFQSPPIEDLVDQFLGCLKLKDETEKEDLTKKTLEVLQLCRDCWLSTGRSPRACIFGAAYLVWKASLSSRSKVSLKDFLKLTEITKCASLEKFVRDLTKCLVKLAKEIPWVSDNEVSSSNITHYLSDILKYSTTLRVQAIEKQKNICNEESVLDCDINESGFDVFRANPYKRTLSEPLNPNLSYEIDEDEIDSYICTKEEIKFKQTCLE